MHKNDVIQAHARIFLRVFRCHLYPRHGFILYVAGHKYGSFLFLARDDRHLFLSQLHVDLAMANAARWGMLPCRDSMANGQQPETEPLPVRSSAPSATRAAPAPVGMRPLAEILSDPSREYAVAGTIRIPRHTQTLACPPYLDGCRRPEFGRFRAHE